MQCCLKLRPCTQRLNLLMILSTIDVDSSFTFYAEENLKLLHSLFLRVFLMSNTFPAPCCPDPSSWNVLLPSNSTWAYLFFNEIKYLSLDISCFLCSTVNDISQDFWNWSCRNLVYNTSMPTMCPSFILSDLQVCADTNTSCVWPRWRRATSLGYNFHVLWCKISELWGSVSARLPNT